MPAYYCSYNDIAKAVAHAEEHPKDRAFQFSDENPEKNIGIRLVMNLAHDVTYQNLLGLNVLTIRFPVLNQ